MTLHGYEAKAFSAWEDCDRDYSVLNFAGVAKRAALDRSKVRRAVRGLARKGLVEFVQVSWTDDGEMFGAGYGLTDAGVKLRSALSPIPDPAGGMPVEVER